MIVDGFEGKNNLDRIPQYLAECSADGINEYFEKSLKTMGFSEGFQVEEITENGTSLVITVKTPQGKMLTYEITVKRGTDAFCMPD